MFEHPDEAKPLDRFEHATERLDDGRPANGAKLDPLAPPPVKEFDWETVFTNLDGAAEASGDAEKLAAALMVLLAWFTEPARQDCHRGGNRGRIRSVGLRVLACQYVLNPSAFKGTPSMQRLSESLGLNRAHFSAFASKFTQRFGVVTRAQSHGRNGAHFETLRRLHD